MVGSRLCLLLPIALASAACAVPGLPPGFALAVAENPEDLPVRLWIEGDAIRGGATGVGRGGLPLAVRTTAAAVVTDGETVFQGREWGPAGTGFRIEKRRTEAGQELFCSALIADDGSVLERSHSVPLAKVPTSVLAAATAIGRDVQRCEIVSDREREIGWRAVVGDGLGRTYVLGIDLDGSLRKRHRLVAARIAAATAH